jgi:hypothetical protein
MFKQMARIAIEPVWVKIRDFQTRFPKAHEKAVGRKGELGEHVRARGPQGFGSRMPTFFFSSWK